MEKLYTDRFNSYCRSLDALKEAKTRDRNDLIHDYNEILAANCIDDIIDKYIDVFEKLRERVLKI